MSEAMGVIIAILMFACGFISAWRIQTRRLK